MKWNKVELRRKDKNLPNNNIRVLWATNEDSLDKEVFYKFIGELLNDNKTVDAGINRYKLTSNYWWVDISKDPKIE